MSGPKTSSLSCFFVSDPGKGLQEAPTKRPNGVAENPPDGIPQASFEAIFLEKHIARQKTTLKIENNLARLL